MRQDRGFLWFCVCVFGVGVLFACGFFGFGVFGFVVVCFGVCFVLCMKQKRSVRNKLCWYPNLSAKSNIILSVLKGQTR